MVNPKIKLIGKMDNNSILRKRIDKFFSPNKIKLIIFSIFIILSIFSYVLSQLCPIYWQFDEPGSKCGNLDDYLNIIFIFYH